MILCREVELLSMSKCKSEDVSAERNDKRKRFTLLFRIALAKYCASDIFMPLKQRSIAVSAYVLKTKWL